MKVYGQDIKISFQLLTKENMYYTSNFSCGNEVIDNYFRKEAAFDKTSVTYMYIDAEQDKLISCITIACSAIFTDDGTPEQFSTILSAMEVKYLATSTEYQHIKFYKNQNHGSLSDTIFNHMLYYMENLSHNKIGAAKIVLYSVPSAVNFYKRHGFKSFGNTMYGDEGYFIDGCEPMYFDLND